jgi:PAS domain S-box-containing protein
MPVSSRRKDQPGFFSLLIPADLAELPGARKLTGEVGRQAGLPDHRIFDLQVSVSEATANAIEHAASEVEIEAWILPDRVIVEVTNDGVFQPGLVKNEDTRRRGLGLPLMVSLADQVHVSRLASGKTQVSLTFFLEGSTRPVPGPEPQREGRSREVEDRYRNLVELSPDAILVEADGRHIFANPAAARLLGTRSPRELVGVDVMEHVHPEDREVVAERVNRVMAGAVAPPREIRFVRPDGTIILAEVTASRVEFEGRLAVQAVMRDITERKLEEAERDATAALLALMNSEPDLRMLTQKAASLFGDVSGCEAVGVRLREGEDFPYFQTTGFPDEFVEMERSLCTRDRSGKLLRDSEGHPIHECMCGNIIHARFDPDLPFFTDGGSFWSNSTTELSATSTEADRRARTRNRCNGEGYESVALIPLRAGGETYGLVQLNDHRRDRFTAASIRMFEKLAATLASGLAERRAREALSESEERFRTMADAIPQLAWVANADGYIHWYNRRWYEYTGTTLAEMEGWGWQSVHDPQALPAVLERWRASIASGEPFDMEFPLRAADGMFRPFLTRVMPQKDTAGRVVQWFGTNTDVTERKRAEEARRKREESLSGVLSVAGRLRVFERRTSWHVFLVTATVQVALLDRKSVV